MPNTKTTTTKEDYNLRITLVNGVLSEKVRNYFLKLLSSEKSIVDDQLASEKPADKRKEIIHYLEQKGRETILYSINLGGKTIGLIAVRSGWNDEEGERYKTRRIFTIIDSEYQSNYTKKIIEELSELEESLEEALQTWTAQ